MPAMKLLRTIFYLAIILIGVLAPWFFYPIFLMKVMCFALFARDKDAVPQLHKYTGTQTHAPCPRAARTARPPSARC